MSIFKETFAALFRFSSLQLDRDSNLKTFDYAINSPLHQHEGPFTLIITIGCGNATVCLQQRFKCYYIFGKHLIAESAVDCSTCE